MSNLVALRVASEIVDNDAVEIGALYEGAKSSAVESVHKLLECG